MSRILSNRPLHCFEAVFLLLLAAVPLIFSALQHSGSVDDAYITYRYARNIAAGHGFVYNLGEPVLGTTTPLYTLLLAGLSLFWPDLPALSHTIGALAWSLSVPLIYAIGRTSGRTVVGLAAAGLIAFNALFLDVLGMETPLYILLILTTFYFYLKEQPLWAAALAGLVFLTRWDGILVAGVLLFALLLHNKRTFLQASAVSASIIVPWLVYSYLTFGSIFPNSFFAKVGQARHEGFGGEGTGSFARGLGLLARSAYAENAAFVLVFILVLVGLLAILKQRDRWWPLLLWTTAYFGGYVALGVVRFHWYYTPLVPALALLSGKGIDAVARLAARRFRWPAGRVAVAAFLTILSLLATADWLLASRRTELDPRAMTYIQVAEWLRENTPDDAAVALLEIGIVGFYSERTVVDTMGLVSPEMIGHLETWLQTLQFAVNYYWPDYVVALEGTAWKLIARSSWFEEAYVLVTEIENSRDPVAPVRIFRRREMFPLASFARQSSPEVVFDGLISVDKFQVVESSVEAGGILHAQILWNALGDISSDYRLHFELLNAANGQARQVAADLQPLRGGGPTYQWRTGERFNDTHTLTLPEDLPDGAYQLRLFVSRAAEPVILTNAGGPLNHPAVGPIMVGNSAAEPVQLKYPLHASWADNVTLTGFDLQPEEGQSITVTLYWQAEESISQDYTVFLHLVGPDGGLLAQHDSPPALPTSIWVPDIPVTDAHYLELPDDVPTGVYELRVGLYQWPSLERLGVSDSGCLPSDGNALLIGRLAATAADAGDELACPELHTIRLR